MRNKFKKIIVFLITALLSASMCGCSEGADEVTLNDFLGAPVTLVFSTSQSISARRTLINRINEKLNQIENMLSTEKASGDIAAFNSLKLGEVEVSEQTYALFEVCRQAYEATGGAFNIAGFMLTDLWGFASRHKKASYSPVYPYDRVRNSDNSFDLPEQKYITAFTALADFSSIKTRTDGEKYYLIKNCKPQYVDGEEYVQKIDMSAIAKGYAADEAKKLIDESGLTGAYISFGGSSLYLADDDGEDFSLGIVNPFDSFRKSFAAIKVKNVFVSSSGVYENCYLLNGKRYHHIIDASKGMPADNELMSVTIIGLDGKLGDAFSTAAMVMGKDKAVEFLTAYGVTYVIVDKDKNVYTNGNVALNNLEFDLIYD